MSKLLDYLGLLQFLNKLKTLFVTALGTSGNYLTWTKNGETSNITVPYSTIANKASTIPFAIIDSTSTSTLLTATTVSGGVVLEDGACCIVYNNVIASDSGCTINIDNLGAKPMYTINSSGTLVTTLLVKAQTFLLIYRSALNSGNGGWRLGILLNTNTTYSAITTALIQAGTATTSRTVTAAVLAEAYNISNGTITIGANSITPLTQHLDISGKEDKTNKVTSLSSSSTDTQYPSAKCVYDNLNDSKPFIVTGTTWNNETLTVDKTAAEVYAAHNSGRIVYLRFNDDDNHIQMQLLQADNLDDLYRAIYFTSYCVNNLWVLHGQLLRAVHTGNTINFENFVAASLAWVLDEIDNEVYNIQNLINNLKTSIVNHGTSDTTFALTPNVYHKWGSVSSLTLTLGTPADNTIVNEYMFEFTSGSTATTLSLPSSVEWAESCGTLSVEASKTYLISIVDNIGLWTSISNS